MNKDRRIRHFFFYSLFLTFYFLQLSFSKAFAAGEINFVRAPSEIPAGDDITIAVSASAREANIDRTVAIEFPSTWKFKRGWRVEAGSDQTNKIAPFGEVSSQLTADARESVIALADYDPDFDPHAAGIGYFIVFSTSPQSSEAHEMVKAALVERISLDAIPKVDPRTKRPIEENHEWHMVFPPQNNFSFISVAGKRLEASVTIERVPRMQRALVVQGSRFAIAPMMARPELITDFFRHSFSIQFWYKTNLAEETLLNLHSDNGHNVRLAIGLLGQLALMDGPKSLLVGKQITNDGAWHYAVFSNDSLGTLRLFVDDELSATIRHASTIFRNISAIAIGDSTEKDFSIDELHFVYGVYREASEFESAITGIISDSLHPAFAIFHFDGFGTHANSIVSATAPIFFTLDSLTTIRETTSPVEAEPVTLTAELPSPSTVHLDWWRTTELGIKEYRLELRVGASGPFESFSTVPAKHGSKPSQRGEPIVSWSEYSAMEELPKMNGDIDLYFRVAATGFNKKDIPQYSLPVKVEYASDRDVFVEQNKPEPFNDTTSVAFTLTKPELVRLSVFDMIGREIVVLENGKLEPGRHAFLLSATGWPGGIYFYKIKTSRATITRKMTVVR